MEKLKAFETEKSYNYFVSYTNSKSFGNIIMSIKYKINSDTVLNGEILLQIRDYIANSTGLDNVIILNFVLLED